MKTIAIFATAAIALSIPAGLLAQVYTPPVGYVTLTVPANSDAAIGAPLERAAEFQGVVQVISGNVITVAGQPGWTTNQFVYQAGVQSKTYYLRIDSDSKEGLTLPITANDSSSVTVTVPAGEDLTGILTNAVEGNGNGSTISIAPYWTPASLVSGVLPGTQLLRYPTNTPGTNLSPSSIYVFSGTNWLQATTVVNDVTFRIGEGIVLRNNSTTAAQSISITGAVPMTAHRTRLFTLAPNTAQDQRIFFNSPVPEAIGNVFPGSSLAPGDRLFAFDNGSTGKNKSPAVNLVWTGSAWLQGTTNVTTTYMLQPGNSYLFRKNQTGASPASLVWSRLQSYLQ